MADDFDELDLSSVDPVAPMEVPAKVKALYLTLTNLQKTSSWYDSLMIVLPHQRTVQKHHLCPIYSLFLPEGLEVGYKDSTCASVEDMKIGKAPGCAIHFHKQGFFLPEPMKEETELLAYLEMIRTNGFSCLPDSKRFQYSKQPGMSVIYFSLYEDGSIHPVIVFTKKETA